MLMYLDVNEQNAIFAAYSKMDTYDHVNPGVEDGPKVIKASYKFGASKRVVIKNMAKLRKTLTEYEEAHKALFREIWPNRDPSLPIKKQDDEDNFRKFADEQEKILKVKEEFDLLQLPRDVAYGNGNEFPISALLTLEEHGLIEEE